MNILVLYLRCSVIIGNSCLVSWSGCVIIYIVNFFKGKKISAKCIYNTFKLYVQCTKCNTLTTPANMVNKLEIIRNDKKLQQYFCSVYVMTVINNLRQKRALWILHKNVDHPVWLDVYVHFIQFTLSVEVDTVKMYCSLSWPIYMTASCILLQYNLWAKLSVDVVKISL